MMTSCPNPFRAGECYTLDTLCIFTTSRLPDFLSSWLPVLALTIALSPVSQTLSSDYALWHRPRPSLLMLLVLIPPAKTYSLHPLLFCYPHAVPRTRKVFCNVEVREARNSQKFSCRVSNERFPHLNLRSVGLMIPDFAASQK